jgi:hypothetical protein
METSIGLGRKACRHPTAVLAGLHVGVDNRTDEVPWLVERLIERLVEWPIERLLDSRPLLVGCVVR